MKIFWIGILILAGSVCVSAAEPSTAFKKEMAPLQSAVDSAVVSSESLLMTPSKAAYIEGYGVVTMLQISFERPRGPFGTVPETAAQVRTLVEQREKTLKAKISDVLKESIGKTEAIADGESMTIVVHILNSNPAAVPDLPLQFIFSAKKSPSPQVVFRVLE